MLNKSEVVKSTSMYHVYTLISKALTFSLVGKYLPYSFSTRLTVVYDGHFENLTSCEIYFNADMSH